MAAQTETTTRIQLCGRLLVEWSGVRIERDLPGRQGRLLFCYLVLHRHRPVRRDELVAALWADDEAVSGPALLAAPLSRLRKVLGPDRIEGRDELTLVLPDDAVIDWEGVGDGLARAGAAIRADEPAAALAATRAALEIAERGLLPGLEAPWIDERRRALRDLWVEALELVAILGGRIGGPELPSAEQAARAAVEAAPFRESSTAALIEVLRARGNVAEALRTYEETRRLLRDELGMAPGPALAELYRMLLDGEPARAPAPPAAPRAVAARTGLPERLVQANLAPFVGRAEQLERLAGLLDQAVRGEGALVLIAGEGGIGKTHLTAELVTRASPLTVLYGRCDEDESTPFGVWIEALTRHLVANPEIDIEATVAGDGPYLARLIPGLGARLPGLPEGAPGDPETERHRLFAAVAALLDRLAAGTPVLLALDDLHWADRSSILLLRQIAASETLGRMLIVGTYRDNELPDGHALAEMLGDLERDRPVVRIKLGGLDTTELAALVTTWRGIDLPAATADAIHQEAAGNPFFMKQLVRHLEELGELEQRGQRTRLAVPSGVRDVIVRRVARLPEDGGRVLKIAALIGREFELEILALVVDTQEDRLLDVLDAAVQAAIIVELPDAPGRYSFAHALLRTTLEHELTATRRARLHARIAEAIERRHAAHLDEYVVELARHFAAAGPDEVDRAVSYALRASERAATQLAYEEAAAHVAAALALREGESHRDELEIARLTLLLGQAAWRAGQWEHGRDAFATAADASRRVDAPGLFARAALGHAGGFERFGTPDRASADLLEEALRRLPAEDSSLRARVLACLSDALYYLGAPVARLHELVHESIDMARRLDDPESLARALAASQYAYWHPTGNASRLQLADELAAVSERLGDPQIEASARIWRSVALLDHCRLEEADRDIDRFALLADELQQPPLMVHAAALRSMRALLEGHWDEGEQAALEVLGFGERSRAVDALQSYGVEMLQLRNEQLRLGELTEHYEMLVREAAAIPAWRAALAWARFQAGCGDQARAEIDDLLRDDLAALPRDGNLVPACAILGHIAGDIEDADLAAAVEPLLRPAASHWVVLGYGPATLGPVAFTLGLASQLTGQLDQAVDDFELALDRSTRMRARPYLAHTEVRLAQTLHRRGAPGDAQRAHELQARGRQTAHELSMTRLLRDADRASSSHEAVVGRSRRPVQARRVD